MEKDIKLLIFDFDGTLADTTAHILNCIKKCIDKFNLRKLSDEDLAMYSGATLMETMLELGATEEQLPEIKSYYTSIFFEDVSDIHLYENVSQVLIELKDNGYVLAVATNRRRKMIPALLDLLGISPVFSKIVCETDVDNKKPSADMVELILKELNYSKDETLVLGDTKYDILMSKNANCKSCYVCHSIETDDNVIGLHPDIVIHDFQELIKLLLNRDLSDKEIGAE